MPERLLLDGVRVVALAETVPTPLASSILADLGADVLVVERPAGDPARGIPAVFGSFARNKRFLALDMRSAPDLERLEEELAAADIVIVGYRPDVARRLEVDPASIARRFPRAVIVSVTAAGDDEEEPIKPAHDLSVRAIAGQLPLDRPMSEAELDGAPVADLLTGAYAAIAALAGLVGRTADRGSILGVSMVDSAFGLNAIALTAALQGLAPEDMMRAPAGYRTFRCGDGALVAIGVSYESHHWATLCQRLGLEHMSSLSVAERVDRRVELNEEFAAVIATMPLDTVIELAGEGLPVEPVRGPADVVAAGLLPVLADRAGTRHLASPIVVDGRRLPVRLAAPGRPVRLAQDG